MLLVSFALFMVTSAVPELTSVAAGSYDLGCAPCRDQDNPIRTVTLAAFRIARTEVTAAQYKECVDAAACTVPQDKAGSTYYGAAGQLPVNYVSRNDAAAYCEWAGMRLCTSSEWEAAGRTTDGRLQPWGSAVTSCERVVGRGNGCTPTGPAAVGSKPTGNTASGVSDLLGNVAEWAADCTTTKGDQGESICSYGFVHGGGYDSTFPALRLDERITVPPYYRDPAIGFRCCADAP